MKNRALKRRVIREVMEPAGVAQLSRELFLVESILDYSAEIEFGKAHEGEEVWCGLTWRSPRYPRVMAALQEQEPNLAEAWRGVGRVRYGNDRIGPFRTGVTSIDLEDNRLVIRSYRDRYGDLREKAFDAAEYFRHLAGLPDIEALAEEINFGLTGQFTTAIDGVWSFLYLACECGHEPGRILADFTGPDYRGLRPAWRLKHPLTLEGVARFQAIYAAEAASG